MTMNKYRCKECGSENLVWRSYAAWDFESQEFKIAGADEEPDFTAFCDDCNAEGEPVKEELEDDAEDKDDLIELVIEQINSDQRNGDLEALYEFLDFVDSDRLIKYLSITLQDIALERGIINSVPISRTGLRETSLQRCFAEKLRRIIGNREVSNDG
jgi:hypothetical protein